MGKGAVVGGAVVFALAHGGEAGVGFVHVNAHEEEAFVVAKGDVVARAVFFDEATFEQECFSLGAHDVDFEVVDSVEKCRGLHVGRPAAGGVEVLGDALVQVARLADVDDAVEPIAVNIDAWLVRELSDFGFQFGGKCRFGHEYIYVLISGVSRGEVSCKRV